MNAGLKVTRLVASVAMMATLSACGSATGGLGDILGSVLGGGGGAGGGGNSNAQQVAGTIRGVDTRNQQITLQQSNGSSVGLGYNSNTAVIYQNQVYAVTSLENGDQVNARVLNSNGGYYTDTLWVTQSIRGNTSSGTTSGNVQQVQGTVRGLDRQNGLFSVDAGNGVMLTVSLPYNTGTTDVNRYNGLRIGDTVRFTGVYLNNTRVELRNFY